MTDSLDDYEKKEIEARRRYWDSLDKLSKRNRFKLPRICFDEQKIRNEDKDPDEKRKEGFFGILRRNK